MVSFAISTASADDFATPLGAATALGIAQEACGADYSQEIAGVNEQAKKVGDDPESESNASLIKKVQRQTNALIVMDKGGFCDAASRLASDWK